MKVPEQKPSYIPYVDEYKGHKSKPKRHTGKRQASKKRRQTLKKYC